MCVCHIILSPRRCTGAPPVQVSSRHFCRANAGKKSVRNCFPTETKTKKLHQKSAAEPPPPKKAVITSCLMSHWFIITMEGCRRLILLLLQWSEQKTLHNCNVDSAWTNHKAIQHPCFTVWTAPPPRCPECHIDPSSVINELKGFKLLGIQGFQAVIRPM